MNSLSAGGGTDTRASNTFDFSIGLSESGVNHVDDIITEVFHAVNRIRLSGLPEWIFDENQKLDQLAFQFQEKAGASGVVRALSVRAQDWPAEKLISGPYQRTGFDRQGIHGILDLSLIHI